MQQDSFFNLIEEINEFGAIKSPDFIAYIVPLLIEVKHLHEKNLTAQLIDINQISYTQNLSLKTEAKSIKEDPKKLFLKPKIKQTLEIVETLQEVVNVGTAETEYTNVAIAKDAESTITKPVYIPYYKIWDNVQGHYDPITDIFALGQIMASVAFGLDFRVKDDLEIFASNRNRLYFLNKNLHPTLLNIIFEMTHLYREDRPRSLEEIITKLNNYREYNYENYVDLTQTQAFDLQEKSSRSSWILNKLKNRLFDISRRNKLLYFRENASFMNLTISSFPILLDHKNVKTDSLIYWNTKLESKLNSSKKINLNSYLEFHNNSFLAPQLNKIRLDARKSKNEYGFSSLKMVAAFLHWYNFKEDGEEKISSPLLLLPAEIIKKKAIRDIYTLKFENLEAEINPILSNYLKDLYDIELPKFIYLENNAIEKLVHSIQEQIAIGNTGIKLQWQKLPRIQIIHKIAKKNFNLKNRKLINRSRSLRLSSFNYSYQDEDFKPLGLQLFNDRIRPKKSELEYVINDDISPKNNAVSEKERTFYTNNNEGEINPLVWEIDTCNVTIGNFNYRKMSLVRDFDEINTNGIQNPIFEKLFDKNPKSKKIEKDDNYSFENNYPIISSDPTQTASIAYARTGNNYIIQGPPGTGKSQTITNLIADYIARDKKVLFVCEKRAALDVVYHRLKNRKLGELCALIHDSQTDKKAFIQNLKSTYESFTENKFNLKEVEANRAEIIAKLNKEIESISAFHDKMKNGDATVFDLLNTIHATKKDKDYPDSTARIFLPNYKEWNDNKSWILDWILELKNNKLSPFISNYIYAQLDADVFKEDNFKLNLLEKIDESILLLDEFEEFIDDNNFSTKTPFSDFKNKFELADKVASIYKENRLEVFDPYSKEAKNLEDFNQDILKINLDIEKIKKGNQNWKSKFNAADTEEALLQWHNVNKNILRYFKPKYYALKKQIEAAYDFGKHKVKPEIENVLQKLDNEYAAQEKLIKTKKQAEKHFGFTNFEEDNLWVKNLHNNPNKTLQDWLQKDNQKEIENLLGFKSKFDLLKANSQTIIGDINPLNLPEIEAKLNEAKLQIHSLTAFVPFIEKTQNLSKEMKNTLFQKAWNEETFEFNIAYKSLMDVYEADRSFEAVNEDRLEIHVNNINKLLDTFYDANVLAVRAKIRAKFDNKIRITESVAAQLTEDEKILKKKYNSARRILENEFNKSMRYKSIRVLASGDANELITNLKPVWLMSPLSVSDTMPIDTSLFDVVIFDEASQITVEEGIPALFRTKQTIIVGDEMQMPPTNFFSSSNIIDEEEENIENEIGISLDSDSLLNQGSRKLASVMLGWHYRSRRESLISFSNAAFYNRNLLTIPDSKIASESEGVLEPVQDVFEAIDTASILNRSISFHHTENAVYESQRNKDEANYIANMVCTLLKEKVKHSIGIVAFSMKQQSEIEAALERLAIKDLEFEALLEEEYQRTDEDSFTGLFVKNLENVQGDERDIIIMSVCYGHNTNGRMLMNFGPINRKGGEKRLNVIFSRAKKHMVIVSSILAHQIKNDFNVGANFFKKFLSYAKYISDGKLSQANIILDGLYTYEDDEKELQNPLKEQLFKALKDLGYDVELGIGQSHFKCDLAIKNKNDNKYSLGILLDTKTHYKNENVIEQYCQKPQILKSFGWQTLNVYSKDWLENSERVVQKIKNKLEGKVSGIEEETIIENAIEENTIEELKEVEVKKQEVEIPEIIDPKISTNIKFERFEFTQGTSNKFWQIALNGNDILVEYGRIGNKAQSNTKTFDNQEKALQEKAKMIAKKVDKGYLKV